MNASRDQLITSLADQKFDLIVIGGGITGAGILLDAVSRGLKPLLIEKNDFGSGTSSKSTKLIHGGLRYLKQLEIGLVKETGSERAIVHRLAPHLVHPEKMLLPIVDEGTFGLFTATMAIGVYDYLAGVEKEDRKVRLSKKQALEIEPLLPAGKLKGAIVYSEYRTDDARLTIEIIKRAVSLGAVALNYCECQGFLYDDQGKIHAARICDQLQETQHAIYIPHVISAAGPWVDELRAKDGSLAGKRIRHTKGVHIVVDYETLPLQQSVYIDDFDGRMIFVIPRGSITYIGTSDTDYTGDLDDIRCTKADVDYLLTCVNDYFDNVQVVKDDILSSWAGVRPLIEEEGKSASEVSRKDEIFVSDSGLISIAGGKLTGYRKMAQRVLKELLKNNPELPQNKSKTKKLAIVDPGYKDYDEVQEDIKRLTSELANFDLPRDTARFLIATYGKKSRDILEHFRANESTETDEARLLLAEALYCFREEFCSTMLDFWERRTGRLYFKINEVRAHSDFVLESLSKEYGWSELKRADERRQLSERIAILADDLKN